MASVSEELQAAESIWAKPICVCISVCGGGALKIEGIGQSLHSLTSGLGLHARIN